MTTTTRVRRDRNSPRAIPSLRLLHQHLADPGAFYRQLPSPEDTPVYWDKTIKSWVVTGFIEAKEVLGHPQHYSVERLPTSESLRARHRDDLVPLNELLKRQILFTDGASHQAVQDVLLVSFHKKRIRPLQHYIQIQVDRLISTLHEAEHTVDLVRDFSGVLPTLVSAHLLGLQEEPEAVKDWMVWNSAFEDVLASLQSMVPAHARQTLDTITEASDAFRSLVVALRSERGEAQIDEGSLLHLMVQSDLDVEDIVANCVVLLAGGYQTLTQLISRTIYWAYHQTGLRDELVRNPTRITDALKETMRLDGSSQFLGRRATSDSELGGCLIRAGQNVVVLLGAANRDPRKFDDPDHFDLDRSQKDHLGFSFALHHCWGADLAMMEATIAVRAFLERYSRVILPNSKDIIWSTNANVRCPSSFPVQLLSEQPSFPEPLSLTTVKREAQKTYGKGTEEVSLHVHQIFERHASLAPNAFAIVSDTETMTYKQLNEWSNRLAWHLPETVVGVCMPRSPEAIIAFLAILKAGGAYAPLDGEVPDRLAKMAQNADPVVILTSGEMRGCLEELPSANEVVVMDTWMRSVGDTTLSANLPCIITEEHLAYIIYTSGSTGEPKGVEIVHRGLRNLVAAQSIFHVQPRERVLQAASLMFDASIFEIVLALCHGATVCIPPHRSGEGLWEFLHSQDVTVMVLTPTVLLRTPRENLTHLRLVMAAGEPCSASVVERWSATGRELWNLYGPTESTVWSTACRCRNDGNPPDIGQAVVGTSVWILDERLRPVPQGESGILYIEGKGLMRGYRKDPKRTAEVLIRHPFEPNAVLYRTGDVAHLTPENTVVFERREEGAYVKLHGLRIEPEEIEVALGHLPNILGVGVVVRDDSLVAFIEQKGPRTTYERCWDAPSLPI